MSDGMPAERIRALFRPDGEWDVDALNRLDASGWRAWIAARLHGQDPYVRYARDEYPDLAGSLFARLGRQAGSLGLQPEWLREGAALFMAGLDARREADPALLRNAIELVGELRARHPASLDALRRWIRSGQLLERSDWPMELHRSALFALAALQVRGNGEDQRVFSAWLRPWEEGPREHRGIFIPAAFSGLVFSSDGVPKARVQRLLQLHRQAEQEGWPFRLSAAILALWVGRDSVQVRSELWDAIRQMPDAREHWEAIRPVAERRRYYLGLWTEMELLRPSRLSNRPLPPAASPWERRTQVACLEASYA